MSENVNKPDNKEIPFPVFLDNFGQQLKEDVKFLKNDSFKAALISDVIKCMDRMFVLQQMDVLAYTTAVKNWSAIREGILKLEKNVSDMQTQLAGYSERLIAIEGYIKNLEKKNEKA